MADPKITDKEWSKIKKKWDAPNFGSLKPIGASTIEGKGIKTPQISTTLQSRPVAPPPGIKSKGKFAETMEGIVPYLSNLRNAFQTPPMPRVPEAVNPVTLKGVNMDKARQDIRSESRAADIGISSALRSNTAEAYKASNLATKLRALSDVSDKEAQANAQISNQQAQINLGAEAGNVGARNQYSNQLTERSIADQVQKSANIANAADKFIAQRNVKSAEDLERSKFALYSRMFNPGVSNRLLTGAAGASAQSEDDYMESLGFRKKEKGGKMRPIC